MSTLNTQSLAFVLLVGVGLAASYTLLGLYAPRRTPQGEGHHEQRTLRLLASLDEPSRASMATLALVSIFGLFLELLFIRWISSEIRIFAYFKNFILIAAFLGFGLGFQLSRRRVRPLALIVPLVLLVATIEIPWAPLRELVDDLPIYLGAFSEVQVWGAPTMVVSVGDLLRFTASLLVSVTLFGLVSITFVPIGQMIGWHIEEADGGIRAYSVNLLGSLGGIVLFSALAYLGQPPLVWFAVAGALAVAVFWEKGRSRWVIAAVFALCCGLVLAGNRDPGSTHWSPYQKLTVDPITDDGEVVSYRLTTNDSWFQQIVNLSDGFLAERPELMDGTPAEFGSYNLPYRFYEEPESVLVMGSGMGNDVAAALRNGASSVTAVEIDPVIIDLGRQLHFEQPYDDSRVTVVIDDARSYIQNTDDRFDLVVFALLDSQTTASHFSNIRIDNYVYTAEALEVARSLLTDDGLMAVKFQVAAPWIGGRLQAILTQAFGSPPLGAKVDGRYSTGGSFFFAGSESRIDGALADRRLAEFLEGSPLGELEPAVVTTDDWPFFYQKERGIPVAVASIPAVLVLMAVFSLRRVGISFGSFNAHFFFLGAGFLLLEVHIVSKMALLFGTTWVVNSFVVAGVLLLAVLANITAETFERLSPAVGWVGLALTILLSYVLPLESLLLESLWLRAIVGTLVLCIPAFFAGLVFIRSFAGAGFTGKALGWNLFGSLVGGMLESLSLWTGIRSMVIVAAVLYLGAYLSRTRNPLVRPALTG